MAPSDRAQDLDLGQLPTLISPQIHSTSSTAPSSPVDAPSSRLSGTKPGTGGSANAALAVARHNSNSPSHEYGSRFYPRRTRDQNLPNGTTYPPWGPPTASGLSTPLRETIPESPDDTFPDLGSPPLDIASAAVRRARAGTVPSRFPPGTFGPTSANVTGQSMRASPSASPFGSGSATPAEPSGRSADPSSSSSIFSRIRSGTMPHRLSVMPGTSPFGSSVFSSSWNSGRGRASTLNAALDDPTSPARSLLRKDSLLDTDIRTLDYLGLVDPSPQSATADPGTFDAAMFDTRNLNLRTPLANTALDRIANSRFRSYSVNAKEKYASGEEAEASQVPYFSGTITPSAEAAAQALAVTQAQIHQHNLDVQAFAHQASASRPRARTAGLLDSPSSRFWRGYPPFPSRLDSSIVASELDQEPDESFEYADSVLQQSLQMSPPVTQQLNTQSMAQGAADDENSRALWIGNVPPSTNANHVQQMFEAYGPVESARVLSHKGCAFVNFASAESAAMAKEQLDGLDLFPGGGPVRIGYAKVPNATSVNGSSAPRNAAYADDESDTVGGALEDAMAGLNLQTEDKSSLEEVPKLENIQGDILDIVREFGASHEEQAIIAAIVAEAVRFDSYSQEILPVLDTTHNPHNRVYDAPRLREIRKRIDNNACTQGEIEDIAIGMLPEIAELASDYLGNTVVQKLFEFCNEEIKEAMLQQLSPHMAEIGSHKNGTWAAQKIIDVARTPTQMGLIVDGLRPYGVASFLDQYGNYVMQCCLRFQAPWNNFIFEVMLSRLWEVAQGRFGARAMRATLESHFATKGQQKMLAAAIAINAVPLSTNTNGALLLTWYLDTCTVPNRRRVLASRALPQLIPLCTHKVAYAMVLKIVNQRNEPEARDMVLRAIFFSPDDAALVEILQDQTTGVTLIFKILTTPFFEEKLRAEVLQKVKNVLVQIKAQPSQGYKRLMDEVNLTTRGGGGGTPLRDSSRVGREKNESSRPTSKHGNGSGSIHLPTPQANNPQYNSMAQAYMPYGSAPNFQPQANGGYQAQQNGQYDVHPQQGHMQFPMQGQYNPYQTGHRPPGPMYNYPPNVGYVTPRAGGMPFAMGSPAMMAQTGYQGAPGPAAYGQMMPVAGMWPQYPGYVMPPQMQGQGMMGGGPGQRGRQR